MTLTSLAPAGTLVLSLWGVAMTHRVGRSERVACQLTRPPLIAPQSPKLGSIQPALTGAPSQNLGPPTQSKLLNQPALSHPGVYTTSPYTCLVVVPDGQADDHSLITSPICDQNMFITQPGLHFLPFRGK